MNSLIAKSQNSKPSFSLSDKKIGIIGYGQVGSRVKHFMDIFDVKCLLNDPPLFDKTNDQSFVDLEEVLQSDIVTLHVPLTKMSEYPTYNLVNDNFLEKLNPNAIFINTSRGEVVNEKALLSFKKNNVLIGYGGFVHISWENKRSEISFIMGTVSYTHLTLPTSDLL